MDVEQNEKEIAAIEMANFILLSLYREYSIRLLNNPSNKEIYISKMRQIKQDMRHLPRKELLMKVQRVYQPTLKQITAKGA